jgi:hypothetical protein
MVGRKSATLASYRVERTVSRVEPNLIYQSIEVKSGPTAADFAERFAFNNLRDTPAMALRLR